MDPALPAETFPEQPWGFTAEDAEVGEFRPGGPLSQWALARYLVGRAIAESVGTSLLIVALVLLALTGLLAWAGATGWAVFVGVIALGVLAMRALLLGVLRRLSAARQYAPVEVRLRALVADTRGDVRRELRRLRLPGHTWTLPLLALRFVGRKRRRATLERLRGFDVSRVVPRARVDELHLLLRSSLGGGAGRPVPPGAG